MTTSDDELVQRAGDFLTAALTSYGDQVLHQEELPSKGAAANVGLRLLQTTARHVDDQQRAVLEGVVVDAAEEPADQLAASALLHQIARALRKHPGLGRELAALLPTDRPDAGVKVIAKGDRSVAAGGNIGIAITGDGVRRPPTR
jgi:hypothetical protein